MSKRSKHGPRNARGLGLLVAFAALGGYGCDESEPGKSQIPQPGTGDEQDAGGNTGGKPGDKPDEDEDELDAGTDAPVVDPGLDAGKPDDKPDAGDGDTAELRPNILLIVADDLGYSDIGAFGGEIHTPNLDLLAAEGRLVTDHHTAMTCAPTRSMLISGTDHHLVGLGRMGAGTGDQAGQPGYEGYLNSSALSVAELLKDGGYHTYISGKWHLGAEDDQTPKHRGYERSFVLLPGVWSHYLDFNDPPTEAELKLFREDGVYKTPPSDYYATDYFTDRLIEFIGDDREDKKPFYAFAAYTSPHWPMQAPPAFIDRYKGTYDAGYDAIRAARFERQKELGIIPEDYQLPEVMPPVTTGNASAIANRKLWSDLSADEKRYEARRMEVYAAMVENLDWNIGRLIQHLKRTGKYENTFIWFQSDNGAESGRSDRAAANNTLENLGRPGSYVYVGARWAEVSNTPFRLWKSTMAEGGHSVPAIARLPKQHAQAPRFDALTHLTDLVPTFLELAKVENPGSKYKGRKVAPITGKSLLPALDGRATTVRSDTEVLADEQSNHRYVMRGRWKLLWTTGNVGLDPARWQLFDRWADRGETTDVSAEHPEVVAELRQAWLDYKAWAGVITTDGNE